MLFLNLILMLSLLISCVTNDIIVNDQKIGNEMFSICKNYSRSSRLLCVGTEVKGGKLLVSENSGGCIKTSTCTFLIQIKLLESEIKWIAFIRSAGEQNGGKFEFAVRSRKSSLSNCLSKANSSDSAKWPDDTFILIGHRDKQEFVITKNGGKSVTPIKSVTKNGVTKIMSSENDREHARYEFTSLTTLKDADKILVLDKQPVSYALKVWHDDMTSSSSSLKRHFDGCFNFVNEFKFFEYHAPSIYATNIDNNRRKDKESDNLLWLWILLGILGLLLLLLALIFLIMFCCRKKKPKSNVITSSPASSPVISATPAISGSSKSNLSQTADEPPATMFVNKSAMSPNSGVTSSSSKVPSSEKPSSGSSLSPSSSLSVPKSPSSKSLRSSMTSGSAASSKSDKTLRSTMTESASVSNAVPSSKVTKSSVSDQSSKSNSSNK